jgi:hypothetical protein
MLPAADPPPPFRVVPAALVVAACLVVISVAWAYPPPQPVGLLQALAHPPPSARSRLSAQTCLCNATASPAAPHAAFQPLCNATGAPTPTQTALQSPSPSPTPPTPPPPLTHAPSHATPTWLSNAVGKAMLASYDGASSSHVCIGVSPIEVFHGVDHRAAQVHMPAASRMCTLRNVCVRDGTLVYFRDAAHPLPFLYSNVNGSVFQPPTPLMFTSWQGTTSLVVEDGPIPADFHYADAEPVHVLVTRYIVAEGNVGHALADGTWPYFNSMLELGMTALDNQIVYLPLGNQQPARAHDILSSRPARSLSSYPSRTCFPWAIAGTHGRGVAAPMPSSFAWRALHDFVFARYGLPSTGSPAGPGTTARVHIVVRYKDARHSFSNYDHIMKELQRCYPSVATTLFVPERATSLRAEIELLSSASVYITPGGGGAFTSMFLPATAAVIYGAACWPRSAEACHDVSPGGVCCVQVERHVWDHAPHVHVSYYNYGGPAAAMTTNRSVYGMPFLDWDYPVDTTALFVLVDRALFLSRGRRYSVC